MTANSCAGGWSFRICEHHEQHECCADENPHYLFAHATTLPLQGSGWPSTVCGSAFIVIIAHFSTSIKENIATRDSGEVLVTVHTHPTRGWGADGNFFICFGEIKMAALAGDAAFCYNGSTKRKGL